MKEIAIGRADVLVRCRAGAAAQNHLPAHELTIIFTDRAVRDFKAGIGREGAGSPFPDIAEIVSLVCV